jgi:flagellar hook assembly protein FlgD
MVALCTLLGLALQLLPWGVASPVRADSPPKAVFIVGPTNGLTQSNLADAERMAQQAEAVGMDVRRVFFPHATWDNVLANIQGASFVVYMGHGYGWPSPYTQQMTESRQNGMGLNSFDGSAADQYTYYGANKLRESVFLAPNAIVFLNHLCYAAGNAESGMAIPSEDVARQRVDNMANGWLATGARAVFAYSWNQKLNYPQALMTTNKTIDELFMTPATGAAAGSPQAFIGWRNVRFASERTPGAVNHLDPHQNHGYYRAVTGDLAMTSAEWRSGAGQGGGDTTPPPPTDQGAAPQITSLKAGVGGTFGASAEPVGFHPNGDGLVDEVAFRHTVSRAAYLDASVTNSRGETVKTFTVWSAKGAGGSRWNGKDNNGRYVSDGVYTLTYIPRAGSGALGDPASVQVLVLTAIALAMPSNAALFGRDADSIGKSTTLKVTVNQQAQVSWRMIDASGDVVRTVRPASAASAGKLSFSWDGKDDSGEWLPDGWYRSVVRATTDLGSYTQERLVYVGAFRVTPLISSPQRGGRLTLTIVSTEALSGRPTVRFTHPGVAPWSATATKVDGKKYKLTVTIPDGGGAGTLTMQVTARDKEGGHNEGSATLPLR